MDACGGEEALYTPVKDFLEHRFQALVKPALGEIFPLSTITAHAGGQTGRWTKPDLCFVALWRHKFKPSWNLDLHGFEVKTRTGCDPTAVHEAHNHTSLVHFSHLVWHHPKWNEGDKLCREIIARCSRYGVGLIVFPIRATWIRFKSEWMPADTNLRAKLLMTFLKHDLHPKIARSSKAG